LAERGESIYPKGKDLPIQLVLAQEKKQKGTFENLENKGELGEKERGRPKREGGRNAVDGGRMWETSDSQKLTGRGKKALSLTLRLRDERKRKQGRGFGMGKERKRQPRRKKKKPEMVQHNVEFLRKGEWRGGCRGENWGKRRKQTDVRKLVWRLASEEGSNREEGEDKRGGTIRGGRSKGSALCG